MVLRALILGAFLAWGNDRAVLIAPGAIQGHLAAGPDGSFSAVFIKDGNIGFSRSTDQGKTWSEPVVAIDAKGKAKGGMQRGPRVAVDGKNAIYVTAPICYDPAELTKQYPTQELYLAVSTDGGRTFSKPAQVNDVPRQAPESLHWLAASTGGEVFAAWLDRRQLKGPGQDLAYAKISDQGKKIQRNGLLPGPLCECCAPGLSVDGKGNPYLVYREGGKNASRQIILAASSNAGTSFGRVARVNQGDSKVDS
jgi:hypothetical protein